MTAVLHEFEGRTIDRCTVKITGAGDGLSEALAIKKEEIELDEDRYFVLRARCGRVSIETDKNEVTARVHTMKTSEITMVEEDIAKRFLQAAADNLARAKAEADGQMLLDDEQAALDREALD